MMTTLPPELIDAILFHLHPLRRFDDTESIPYEMYQVVKHDLLACSLVCRVWRELSLMHLFYDVRVSYHSARPVSGEEFSGQPSGRFCFETSAFSTNLRCRSWKDAI